MPRTRPQRARPAPDAPFRLPALAIFAVALLVRLLHLYQLHGSPFWDTLLGDARGYDAWALRLAQGDWVGREVFYQAPLYPYLLGLLYAVAGHSLLAVRLVQAVLGAAAAVALAIAARRLFSPRAGLIAGLLLALHPTAIFFDGLLQKSSLDGFFTCVLLLLVAGLLTRPATRGRWLALGIVLGLLSLTRENALLLAAVAGLWCLTSPSPTADGTTAIRAGRWSAAAALAAGLVLVLAPVALRNHAVGGGFYLTTSQFGPNLFIGNNPAADGTYMSLRFGRGAPEFERQDAAELAEAALGRRLSPAEVSSYWTGRATAFIQREPGRWLRLMARKAALLVNADEMLDTESQESHAEWSLPLALLGPLLHFGTLVPLALLGAIVLWPRRRTLWILYALAGAYAASVVLFYVFARYRYPLVPFLILFTAGGVAELLARRRSGSSARPPYRAVAAAAVAAVICNWPLLSSRTMRAITETNLGLALQDAGAVDRARPHYERAIALDPAYAPAYGNLGLARRAAGDAAGAIEAYERALTLLPGNADLLLDLGNARVSAGDLAGAIEAFGRAAAAGSADGRASLARASYDLGSRLLEASQFAAAEARLRAALDVDPAMPEAYNNLGIALGSQGRLDEAIAAFQHALSLRPAFPDARRNLATAVAAKQQ